MMYVTKVINPEREIKKRLMAKELESVLQEQIAAKQKVKEEEKRIRLLEEQQEEERWRREREEMEKEKMKYKTVKQSEPSLEVNNAPQEVTALETNEEILKRTPYRKHDVQLLKIRNQMQEKEEKFHKELEKLQSAANTRESIDNQLLHLRSIIVKRPDFSTPIPSFETKASEHYLAPKMDHYTGIGKYGKLHFTNFKKILSSTTMDSVEDSIPRYNKFDTTNFLLGESQMVPWTEPIREKEKMKSKTMNNFTQLKKRKPVSVFSKDKSKVKSTCEKLDDLMREFMAHKRYEDKAIY